MEVTKLIEAGQTLATRISEAVGKGAEWLWPILIRQQYVEATQWILGWGFIATGLFWLGRHSLAHSKGAGSDEKCFFGGLGYVLSVCGLMIACMAVFGVVGKFINPEYYALIDLTSMVKNSVK
jgi:hypothetical protein